MSSAVKQQRMDHFFAAHRESGLPVTTQRRAVCGQFPQISRMTVHRILGAFVSRGLVAKTCHPGSAARFDPKLRQHHHLVCLDCGRISDVDDSRLDHLPWPSVNPHEFEIQDYHVHFRGRCARCHQKPRALLPRGNKPNSKRSNS